jgi:hypothetical protein
MPMTGPPLQVQPVFSAWRKDMASHGGSAVSANSLRPTALIDAKPLWREGRFQHRLNYLSYGIRPRQRYKSAPTLRKNQIGATRQPIKQS